MIKVFWRVRDEESIRLLHWLKELYGEKTWTKTLYKAIRDLWRLKQLLEHVDLEHTIRVKGGTDELAQLAEWGEEATEAHNTMRERERRHETRGRAPVEEETAENG